LKKNLKKNQAVAATAARMTEASICIATWHTDQGDLQTLKHILEQHELEGIPRWDKDKKAKQ
jgi:hypothetical protein